MATNKLIDLSRLSRFWDKVKAYIDTNDNAIVDKIYPVGSIYMSVTDSTAAAVEARFGGTWVAFGSGKTLVGVDGNDTDFDTVEETGGSKNESYTPAGSNTAVTLTAAQSGVPAHAHSIPAHGHSMTQPVFTVNSTGSCTISSSGGHSHSVSVNDGTTTANLRINNAWMTWVDGLLAGGSNKSGFDGGTARPGYITIPKLTGSTTSNGAHTHTVPNHTHTLRQTTNAAVTDKAAFNSNNNTAANASQSHNHTFTGTAATINHVQPYITVYMYKRTA